MVKVIVGNIFESEAQTLVNTVNCVGIMGKGLALEFKKRFPDMFKDYLARCRQGKVQLGRPYLFRRLVQPWILLFPTKKDWRSVSRLSDIEVGLQYLMSKYKEWGITSISVPPLGCGLGELEWSIVGPTLYRYLERLEIPVELYAPYGTPEGMLTAEFLGEPSQAQVVEAGKRLGSRIEPGFIPIIEVLRRMEDMPYHWPTGRVTFQKITYFGTLMGLKTGLEYQRGSFGPFSPQLKSKLTKLVNNRLISEEKLGQMFMVKVGSTFDDARKSFKEEITLAEPIIEKLTDLFCRLNTKQAELAATVFFAWKMLKSRSPKKPTEENVLDEVMCWKQRRRPHYDKLEVAKTIRNLAVRGWLDVAPSTSLPKELENELEV
jgi:O-acetyl-ADP-ribose deacetylase (regulator of RNase III)/uncharacterized protein YwgA